MSSIHTETFGSGKPLVMLHGWAMHTGVWRDFAEQLGQHCRVICLDLPGHGLSEPLPSFTLTDVADALADNIEEESFNLLGWSLGASVALELASRHPQRVRKVLMLAGNPCFVQSADWPGVPDETLSAFSTLLAGDMAQTLVRFLALQVNGLAHGRQLLQSLKTAIQQAPLPSEATLAEGLEILRASDLREQFMHLPMPVAMILAGRDTLVPVALADSLRRLRADVELQILDEAGHAPFLSHAAELCERLPGMLR